jgi:hypothetical protein
MKDEIEKYFNEIIAKLDQIENNDNQLRTSTGYPFPNGLYKWTKFEADLREKVAYLLNNPSISTADLLRWIEFYITDYLEWVMTTYSQRKTLQRNELSGFEIWALDESHRLALKGFENGNILHELTAAGPLFANRHS